ncbi:MAG TPA: hypothetical protein VI911_07155 [Patescibacteria group bacterium]|nr:hypothetical protein [Patescibacteria group bacterium]
MRWSITIESDGTSIRWSIPPAQSGVRLQEVVNGVASCLAPMIEQGLTLALWPPVLLPDGWEATLDGVSVVMMADTGTTTFHRTYRNDDLGLTVDAPCESNGDPIPDTLTVLNSQGPVVDALEE